MDTSNQVMPQPSAVKALTVRQLLGHDKAAITAVENKIGKAAMARRVHDFCSVGPQGLGLTSHFHQTSGEKGVNPHVSQDLPILGLVYVDEYFRISLRSFVTGRGLPLIVSPTPASDICDTLIWIEKCTFTYSPAGWNICANDSDMTVLSNRHPPRRKAIPTALHVSGIVRAFSQIVSLEGSSSLFLTELGRVSCHRGNGVDQQRFDPEEAARDTCTVVCISQAAKWWPRIESNTQVSITSLQPMTTRAGHWLLKTTPHSNLINDIHPSSPPPKLRKSLVPPPLQAPSRVLYSQSTAHKLFDLISYEGVVTYASGVEVILDRAITLSVSSQLRSSLHLFQLGSRVAISCALAVPGLHSSILLIPTVRTMIRLVCLSDVAQNPEIRRSTDVENHSPPKVGETERVVSMYWQRCLQKKFSAWFTPLEPGNTAVHSSCLCDLHLLFRGDDGRGGIVGLLHQLRKVPDSKDTFDSLLTKFINPLSSFETSIPFCIPCLEKIETSSIKAVSSLCTEPTSYVELFQGYSRGTSKWPAFRINWTDTQVPASFFSRNLECVLVGVLHCTKVMNVYALTDETASVPLRCYGSVPLESIGALVAVRRYRIIANSWKRKIFVICKEDDIDILVNGPNLASRAKNENVHKCLSSSMNTPEARKEFRFSSGLRNIEKVARFSNITEHTSVGCLVARDIHSKASRVHVSGWVVAKKSKGQPWQHCAVDGMRLEEVVVSFKDKYWCRLACMLGGGDLVLMSYVEEREWNPNQERGREGQRGEGASRVSWRFNTEWPFVKALDITSGCEDVVPQWVVSRIREDSELRKLIDACKERCGGKVCDPLWMGYKDGKGRGVDVVSLVGSIVDIDESNLCDGPVMQLMDRVYGLVKVEIVFDSGTSLGCVCSGLQVKVGGVRRMVRHGASVVFRGTEMTRIEVLEGGGSSGNECMQVATVGSVGRCFPYACFPDRRGGSQADGCLPRIVNVRYRNVMRLEGEVRVGFGYSFERENKRDEKAGVLVRADDGTMEFDLMIPGAAQTDVRMDDRRGHGLANGGAGVREGGTRGKDEAGNKEREMMVGGGPETVLYQVCDDGEGYGGSSGEAASGGFECIQLRRHVKMWTCVAKRRARARRLFHDVGEDVPLGSSLCSSLVRYAVSVLEQDE